MLYTVCKMLNVLNALILGIVEGITEFLPISSTAHLLIAGKLLHISQNDFSKFFDVFIQLGAILAVVFLYMTFVLKHKQLIGKLLVSFIPTAIVGFLFYETIKGVFFESFNLMSTALFLFGLIFIILEWMIKKKKFSLTKTLKKISYKDAFWIGLMQSLAIVPGVSRAGIIIVSMMSMKFKREDSAIYSFLLAVPTIGAASLLDLYKSRELLSGNMQNVEILIVGFVASLVTAYLTVKWLTSYLRKNSLTPFGIYRVLLAIIVMFV